MAGRMTTDRATMIMGMVAGYLNLQRRECDVYTWLESKLSCSARRAADQFDQARKVLGAAWVLPDGAPAWMTAAGYAARHQNGIGPAVQSAADVDAAEPVKDRLALADEPARYADVAAALSGGGLAGRITALVDGLAGQQAMPDDTWKPQLAAIVAPLPANQGGLVARVLGDYRPTVEGKLDAALDWWRGDGSHDVATITLLLTPDEAAALLCLVRTP